MDSSAERKHTVRGIPASPAGFTCDRIELRVQALELATRGWPVVPGTYLESGQWMSGPETPVRGHSTDRPAATQPEPVQRDWQRRAGLDTAAELAGWWAERPHGLLVATGTTTGAIEVDADLGRRTAQYLRGIGALVPIVATPLGEWYFLTSGVVTSADSAIGAHESAELVRDEKLAELNTEHAQRVRAHGSGSWVPLPPTAFSTGVVHWRVKPGLCGWRLPTTRFVCAALHAVLLSNDGTRTGTTTERPLNVANLLTVGR